jgi:hypothetical protein
MMKIHEAQSYPLWVMFFHRLARYGKADGVYSSITTGKSVVKFEVSPVYAEKFTGLADAQQAWLFYKERSER